MGRASMRWRMLTYREDAHHERERTHATPKQGSPARLGVVESQLQRAESDAKGSEGAPGRVFNIRLRKIDWSLAINTIETRLPTPCDESGVWGSRSMNKPFFPIALALKRRGHTARLVKFFVVYTRVNEEEGESSRRHQPHGLGNERCRPSPRELELASDHVGVVRGAHSS